MSMRHRWRPVRRRRRSDLSLTVLRPSRWKLWTLPPTVIAYVLTVEALALGAVIATSHLFSITSTDLSRLLFLAIGSAVHVEAARGVERLRQVASEGTAYANLKGMWTFAAVLLLPPVLAAALIAATTGYWWFRLRRDAPHRAVFNTAAVTLAGAAAAVVLHAISPTGYPGFPPGPLGLVALIVAGLAYQFLNLMLVMVAMMLSNPTGQAGRMLGHAADHLIVSGSLGLGVATASLLVHEPWSVAVLLITLLGLHQAIMVGHFQTASRTDGKTGLANAVFWHEMAGKELARARRTNTPLSVIYLDLDHFKGVNDSVGHPAGDQVLKAVADAIKHEVRADDLVSRFGGDEFTILLPETNAEDVVYTAERVRRRVTSLIVTVKTDSGSATVDELSCSIGTATCPEAGPTLEALLQAADAALYKAKDSGRNAISSAPAVADPAANAEQPEQPDDPAQT